MKVVLLEDVRKVGKKGEIVEVSDGYGRNFLLNKKLAVLATKKSMEILDEQNLQHDLEEKQKEAERIEKERIKKYKKEHFEDYILEKIDNGIDLTEKEIREVLAYEIDCEEGENGRWTRSMYSVVKLKDRLFGISWEEGLTEFQENEYMYQPEEVVKKEEEKVVKVVRYEKIK